MKYVNWLFGKDGALMYASAHGDLELARELVNDGANVNVTSRNGFTPLHRAAQNGHTDVVRWLLQCGADASARSKGKDTPLTLSRQNGHKQIVKLLEKHLSAQS